MSTAAARRRERRLAKQRIRERMERRGLTYAARPAEIGITVTGVSEIVNGRTTGATARYSLARALDCWPEDLWWDTEPLAAVP